MSFGFAVGGGGLIGVPVRYRLGKDLVAEAGLFYRPIVLINEFNDEVSFEKGGPMLTGGINYIMNRKLKEYKGKYKKHGVYFKGGHSFSSFSDSFLSAGWAVETFKINKSNRSFIFELGPAVFFNHWVTESDFFPYKTNKVSPVIFFNLHWNWYKSDSDKAIPIRDYSVDKKPVPEKANPIKEEPILNKYPIGTFEPIELRKRKIFYRGKKVKLGKVKNLEAIIHPIQDAQANELLKNYKTIRKVSDISTYALTGLIVTRVVIAGTKADLSTISGKDDFNKILLRATLVELGVGLLNGIANKIAWSKKGKPAVLRYNEVVGRKANQSGMSWQIIPASGSLGMGLSLRF